MTGNDHVADVVHLLQGFLGGGEFGGVWEDLTREEMILGRDTVTGDEDGGGREGKQHAAGAGV